MAFYPDKKVYGVPGFPDISACDFINSLKSQAASFETTAAVFSEKITQIRFENETFILNSRYSVKNIILATGIGNMQPNIPSNIIGMDLQENDGFTQYYCMRMDLYRGKNVIIAGGGDSAADFAINISGIANKVTVIHRREVMTCDNNKLQLIGKIQNIELKLSHNIKAIEAGERIVTDRGVFKADHIVFCYGFRASPDSIGGLEKLGVISENGLIPVDFTTMQTKSDKIFAIGDAVTYKNKKKNIVSCFFEADRAVRIIRTRRLNGVV